MCGWLWILMACGGSAAKKKYDVVETPYGSNCVVIERKERYAEVECWPSNGPIPEHIRRLLKNSQQRK